MFAIVKTKNDEVAEFIRRQLRNTPNLVPGMKYFLDGYVYLSVDLGKDIIFRDFKSVIGQIEGVVGVVEVDDD